MTDIAAFGFSGSQATSALFGANVLATRGTLEQGGDYDQVIEALGVGSFRYPGGSLTERYFDINNPNATVALDRDTGEMRDFIPLNEAMEYASAEGLSVTIVIPTRHLLSDYVDTNGDRFADFDEDALRGFVRDVVSGAYGDAEVDAFELGNEYWGSGQMSSVEYGRLASEMAVVVNDELDLLNSEAEIVVQSGTNFNFARMSDDFEDDMTGAEILSEINALYGLDLGEDALFSSGEVNWTNVANEMILAEFDAEAEQNAVDQVAVHVYSRGQVNDSQRTFFLNNTDETWGEELPDAQIAVTEWNTAGNTQSLDRNTDYGLYQSHEMINVMEEFMRYDVEQAHVWPLIQNTPNTLSVDDGEADLTPGGAIFGMMQEALPGMVAIDLNEEGGSQTEIEENGMAVHGFWQPDELLFYVAATDAQGVDTTVDFSDMVSEVGAVEITHLGVEDGAAIGSNSSDAVVTELNPDDVMIGNNLSVNMSEGEILQIRMSGFTPSRDFQSVISENAPEELPEPMILPEAAANEAEIDFPTVPFTAVEAEAMAFETEDDAERDGENDLDGLADLVAAIPFIGLLAFFV